MRDIELIRTTLQEAGFSTTKQPERQRLACWLGAANGDGTRCPVDGVFYHPMPARMTSIINRLEHKRLLQNASIHRRTLR